MLRDDVIASARDDYPSCVDLSTSLIHIHPLPYKYCTTMVLFTQLASTVTSFCHEHHSTFIIFFSNISSPSHSRLARGLRSHILRLDPRTSVSLAQAGDMYRVCVMSRWFVGERAQSDRLSASTVRGISQRNRPCLSAALLTEMC